MAISLQGGNVAISQVYTQVERVDPAVCEKARKVSVADIHEAMGPNARSALMTPRMRPLNRGLSVAGPAVTAFCSPADNLMMHRALFLARPGDVLVVVCAAENSGAQWGDVAANYAQAKGLAGVVVQGCIRDTDTLERMRFPVWSTLVSPARPAKSGHGTVNAPVSCDGVIVHAGDLVVADGDGVVVVPADQAAEVIEASLQPMERDEKAIRAVASDGHPWHLTGAADIYAQLDGEEMDAPYRRPA
ncbi:MAG: 4-carboxy-4-hydroxy-2-oxoadipate aldolase/oxaloacetate decarboxylase [Xanthomonadaceae bacterium]|nr:4-carboxy-4-hydroxy-2-oxoadipate aldolase/oxaloacetate decarboxylase [Xanthomonadaceae bacterium]